jgi:chlorite dismutase
MMSTHFEVEDKYLTVGINTGYSFDLDDQEFVFAFDTNSLSDVLDLVMELRKTRART